MDPAPAPSVWPSRFAALSLLAWMILPALLVLLPPLDVPGYLQAFITGCAVPVLLTPALVWWARRAPNGVVLLLVAALLGALPAVVTGAWGQAHQTLCRLEPAVMHTLLGPVGSAMFIAAVARLVTLVVPRQGVALVLVAVWLAACVLMTLWGLYWEPQAFALDHVFGHFRGPIYDEGTPPLERPAALRLLSVAYILALLAASRVVDRWRGEKKLHPLEVLVLAVALVGAAGMRFWTRPILAPGHAGILEVLSGEERSPHAVIHFSPTSLGKDWRARVALEVERHIQEMQPVLRIPVDTPIHVYLYPSEDEKARLMGSGSTLLARPWAREIHVQGNGLPIPALRHELAHVLLGELAPRPFKVASWLGVFPHTLLIEGAATALEEGGGELTLHQQAAVMLKMGKLPPISRILSPLGFITESGARAYGAAGSFLRFIKETQGDAVFRDIYARGSLGDVDVDAAEQAWHAALTALVVPEKSTGAAKRTFKRGGIRERRCVDDVRDMWGEARAALSKQAMEDAEALLRQILGLNPDDDGPLLVLLDGAVGAGDLERVARVEAELEGRGLEDGPQAQVLGARARVALNQGRLGDAVTALDASQALADGAANQRQAMILSWAAHGALELQGDNKCVQAFMAIPMFVVGQGPERAKGRSDLVALERAEMAVPRDASGCAGKAAAVRSVLLYLEARQLVAEDPYRALPMLQQALDLGMPFPAMVRETHRQLAEAHEWTGWHAAAAREFELYGALATTDGEREEAAMLQRRAMWAARWHNQVF